MERPEDHYYKLNRILLLLSGLWPYQNKWKAYLARTVITLVLLSSIFFQVLGILTSNITANYMVDMVPAILYTSTSLMHMYARVRNEEKDFSVLQYVSATGCSIWLFMPDILDVISPMNESHPRIQPFRAAFFFDEERYYFLIQSHICIVILIYPLNLLINATLCMTLTQHACGMWELLGFVHLIQCYHTIPFLLDMLGLVCVMSLALTQITIASNIEQAFRSTCVAIVTMMYLFLSNYMGQKISDTSSSACEKVYNSAWYNANVTEQKLLLLIMKRRFHPLILNACGCYELSLQNFGVIFQTVISYCMVMRRI